MAGQCAPNRCVVLLVLKMLLAVASMVAALCFVAVFVNGGHGAQGIAGRGILIQLPSIYHHRHHHYHHHHHHDDDGHHHHAMGDESAYRGKRIGADVRRDRGFNLHSEAALAAGMRRASWFRWINTRADNDDGDDVTMRQSSRKTALNHQHHHHVGIRFSKLASGRSYGDDESDEDHESMSEVVHNAEGLFGDGDGAEDQTGRWRTMRKLQQTTTTTYYCVANSSAETSALQTALDWACGSGSSYGNADCSALQVGGSCYSPDDLVHHASYAFNYYYVAQKGAVNSCNFGGVAYLTTTNPSNGTCVYPSLVSGTSTASPPPPSSASGPSSSSSSSTTSSSSSILLTSNISYTICALLISFMAAMELTNLHPPLLLPFV